MPVMCCGCVCLASPYRGGPCDQSLAVEDQVGSRVCVCVGGGGGLLCVCVSGFMSVLGYTHIHTKGF